MKFVKVDVLPVKTLHKEVQRHRTDKHNMIKIINEFLESDAKYAKVILARNDFKSPSSAYVAINQACRYHNLPAKVRRINGELYLVRTEVE